MYRCCSETGNMHRGACDDFQHCPAMQVEKICSGERFKLMNGLPVVHLRRYHVLFLFQAIPQQCVAQRRVERKQPKELPNKQCEEVRNCRKLKGHTAAGENQPSSTGHCFTTHARVQPTAWTHEQRHEEVAFALNHKGGEC